MDITPDGSTGSTTTADEDEQAIRDLVALAAEAQSDAEVLPSLHTSDTVIVNFVGRRVAGREALAEAMQVALASPLRQVRTAVEILDIRTVTPDVAIVGCIKHVYDERDGADAGDLPSSSGVMTYMLSRQDEGWRIASAQTTPVVGG